MEHKQKPAISSKVSDRGASTMEYALIIALVGIVLVAAAAGFDYPIRELADQVGELLGV